MRHCSLALRLFGSSGEVKSALKWRPSKWVQRNRSGLMPNARHLRLSRNADMGDFNGMGDLGNMLYFDGNCLFLL